MQTNARCKLVILFCITSMLQIVKWRLLSSGPEYCKYKVKQLIFIICQISSKRFEYHDSSSSPVILSKRGMFLSLTTISSFNMQTINSENSVTFWHRLGLQYNDFQKIPVAQIQVLLLRIKLLLCTVKLRSRSCEGQEGQSQAKSSSEHLTTQKLKVI